MDEIRIGTHMLQPRRQLLANGVHVHLGPRALEILTVLAEAQGEIVTKDEIFESIWPGQIVEENALQAHVAAIRKALGDDAELLRTIRGVGYELHGTPTQQTGGTEEPELASTLEEDAFRATSPSVGTPARGRRLILAGAAAAILMLGGAAYLTTNGAPSFNNAIASEPVAVAIAPFSVIGGSEGRDEQLGAGLAGALNASLSQLSGLALRSNSAPSQMANRGMTLPEIAEQLGVEYFVEGEIKFEGKDVVLSISLVEGATAKQVWRDQFRGPRNFLPLIADTATHEVARIMQTRLGVGTGEIADSSGVDPQAYEAYLRAMQYFLGSNTPNNRKLAFEEFRRSTLLDQDFAQAHAGIGATISEGIEGLSSTPEGDALARQSIVRALELDPKNLVARVAKLQFLSLREGKIASALPGYKQIVKEHPDNAYAQHALAHALSLVGEHRAALLHSRQALRIDPLNRGNYGLYLLNLFALGDYEEIRSEALQCVECGVAVSNWLTALIFLADEQQFAADVDLVLDRLSSLGVADEVVEKSRIGMTAMREGRPNPIPVAELSPSPGNVIGLAQFGDLEAALQLLKKYPNDVLYSGDFIVLLDTPGWQLPGELRADPRYHTKFDNPLMRGAIAERRKRGYTQNLPVFPVRHYAGS